VYDSDVKPSRQNTLSKRAASLEQRVAALEQHADFEITLTMEERLTRLESVALFASAGAERQAEEPFDPDKAVPMHLQLAHFLLTPGDDRIYRMTQLEEFAADQTASNEDDLWQLPVFSERDIVNKGVITPEAAKTYWQTFSDRCAYKMGWIDERKMVLHFREETPLLFAACCSIGAHLCDDLEDADKCIDEALALAQSVLFMDELPSRGTELGDLKGLLVICVHWSMPRLVGAISSLIHYLGIDTVFAKLTDADLRGDTDERNLIRKGRLWLLGYIYCDLSVTFDSFFLCFAVYARATQHGRHVRPAAHAWW
jgi:hypothetical protein